MSEIEDRLSAWLDGALSSEETAAFEAELARDPSLAERAAQWRGNDSFIVEALAPLAEEPIPADMLARMGLAETHAMPPPANDNPPWWRQRWVPIGGALAAGLALVLVMVQRPDAASQNGGLSLALETTPALVQAKLADGRLLKPLLTLKAADGRWCREYHIDDRVGLACRQGNHWKVEAEGAIQHSATGSDIQVAGSESDPVIEAAHTRLKTADPLDPGAERALLEKQWGDR